MQDKILIKNDQGQEKEFDILFTFTSNDTGKDYITYTDYEKDEQGNIKCYSVYKDNDKLLPVTTEKDNPLEFTLDYANNLPSYFDKLEYDYFYF